jgi:hypothetical protein
MNRAGLRALFLLTAVGAMACVEGVVSGGRPLSIQLTATPTRAPVGDSVEFAVEASGVNLIILRLDFGDGARDSLSAEGAVGATLKRKHAYVEEGAYVAFASVLDVSENGLITIADSVFVEVVPR